MSLGVGTFSLKQKYAVEDALEELRKQDSSLEEFFSADRSEHFFVKNLESIQGDERDVIFLSIGYGKDPGGKLSMNFGPINKLGGERRLNVLVTRARLRLEIFSSIRGIDFDLSKTESIGVHFLKQYLDYAQLGKDVLSKDITLIGRGEEDSLFEESVYQALLRLGIMTHKQVGCSGYRIDLAVVDPNYPGRYILGIECDGAYYHSSVTARDRDRLRQQVLEDLGWVIYRVWSTDWFRSSKKEIEKLIEFINLSKEGKVKKKFQNRSDFTVNLKQLREGRKKEDGLLIPYSLTPVRRVGPSEKFYKAPDYQIANILVGVVEHEGPIHKDEARRRVIQHWDLSSIKNVIEEILDRVELFSIKSNLIKKKKDFYWPVKGIKLKIRSRDVEGVNKSIEYIAPEEIEEAAKFILNKEYSMPLENLVDQVAGLLGFNRVTEDISRYIKKNITPMIKDGGIKEVNGKLTLALN